LLVEVQDETDRRRIAPAALGGLMAGQGLAVKSQTGRLIVYLAEIALFFGKVSGYQFLQED
jgi:hypothetical protein